MVITKDQVRYLCQACLYEFTKDDIDQAIPDDAFLIVKCPHCLCTNRIHPESNTIALTFHSPELYSPNAKKHLIKVSGDLVYYIQALKGLNFEYTQVFNEGLVKYIESLSQKQKKMVHEYINLIKKNSDQN
jgi:hypothetical protein